MKNILLGMAVATVVGIVLFLPRKKDEMKLMHQKIDQLQEHFKRLDRASA